MTQLDTNAARLLRLAPDWPRPEAWLPVLSHYVARVPADADVCLCIVLDERAPAVSVVEELLGLACATLAGGRPFAEVLVVGEVPADRDAVTVSTPEELADALSLPLPAAPPDAPAIVTHARRAKALADRLRAIHDRWRYETAPAPPADGEPLVSVRIPTWNGRDLLVSRAIASVIHGSYRNVEVVVCSDGPDPETRAAVEAVPDPRVRYLELPGRPGYAGHFNSFWQTAGIFALNHALDHCRGDFIAALDHDDAFTVTHVHELLATLRQANADFAYGQALCETVDGPWQVVGSAPLAHGHVAHGTVLYSRRLAHFRYDQHSWLIGEPGDWNMWRRIAASGARVAHHPQVVLAHYRERTSIQDDPNADELGKRGIVQLTAEDLANDVVGTDARWLLDVALPPEPLAAAA